MQHRINHRGQIALTNRSGKDYAYYDEVSDIAWIPIGESDDVISLRVPYGLIDYDRKTRKPVGVEVWNASTRIPSPILTALKLNP